jgi:hypothetical protein
MSTKKYIFMNWYKTAQSFGDLVDDESEDMVSDVITEIDFNNFKIEFSQVIDSACDYIESKASEIAGMAVGPASSSEIRNQASQWVHGLYNTHRDKEIVKVYVNHSISNMKLYPRVPMADAWKLGEIVTCTVMALWGGYTLAEMTILAKGGIWESLADKIDEGKIKWRSHFINELNSLEGKA